MKILKSELRTIKTQYLEDLYDMNYPKMVPRVAKQIKSLRKKIPFDAVAITGISGAGMGFPVSYLLKIPLINVRKAGSSHYQYPIEGVVSAKSYLILDDFIESGKTVDRILKVIKKELGKKVKPVGIFLYNSNRIAPYKDLPVFTLKD